MEGHGNDLPEIQSAHRVEETGEWEAHKGSGSNYRGLCNRAVQSGLYRPGCGTGTLRNWSGSLLCRTRAMPER